MLYANTTGIGNTANGYNALTSNTTGSSNTANGKNALTSNTSGSFNTAYGFNALATVTSTGTGNTAIGTGAGNSATAITTGTYNTFIGYNASSNLATRTNSIAIAGNGNLAFGGDNNVRIGNASMTSIGGQVGWTTISDERTKENFRDDVKGLAFIMKLKPLTYNYNVDKENELMYGMNSKEEQGNSWNGKYDIEKIRFSGFRAQEVYRAAEELGFEFSGVDKSADKEGLWALRYADFVVPIVKAIQEQQSEVEKLKTTVESQQLLIDQLKREGDHLKADYEARITKLEQILNSKTDKL